MSGDSLSEEEILMLAAMLDVAEASDSFLDLGLESDDEHGGDDEDKSLSDDDGSWLEESQVLQRVDILSADGAEASERHEVTHHVKTDASETQISRSPERGAGLEADTHSFGAPSCEERLDTQADEQWHGSHSDELCSGWTDEDDQAAANLADEAAVLLCEERQ